MILIRDNSMSSLFRNCFRNKILFFNLWLRRIQFFVMSVCIYNLPNPIYAAYQPGPWIGNK